MGIALASCEQGDRNLTEIVGSPTSVGDICLVIVSVGTDHNIRSGSVAEGGGIDPGSTHVGDIWSKADICWGSLVGAGVGSGYLVGIDVS